MIDKNMVNALLEERAGLLRRGLNIRVAEVDAQLKLRDYDTSKLPQPEPDTDADDSDGTPKGRSARPPRQTTSS